MAKGFISIGVILSVLSSFTSDLKWAIPHLPTRQYKVCTILDNSEYRAADGTTPAVRFFGWWFKDLFGIVLYYLDALLRSLSRFTRTQMD